jgi:hypothetical protein
VASVQTKERFANLIPGRRYRVSLADAPWGGFSALFVRWEGSPRSPDRPGAFAVWDNGLFLAAGGDWWKARALPIRGGTARDR